MQIQTNRQAIAERRYSINGVGLKEPSLITIRILEPRKSDSGAEWQCEICTAFGERTQDQTVYGVDSFQAVELALKIATVLAERIAEDGGGKLEILEPVQ